VAIECSGRIEAKQRGQILLKRWLGALCLMATLIFGGVAPLRAQQPAAGNGTAAPGVTANTVSPEELTKVREAALRASGAGSSHGVWRLAGHTRLHGADQTFELTFDDRFRFRERVVGPVPELTLYDGANCWVDGVARRPHRIILHGRDVNLLWAWTLTGLWALRSAPLTLQSSASTPTGAANTGASGGKASGSESDGNAVAIQLTPRNGIVSGTLILDRATMLPQSLRYWSDEGSEIWTFTQYERFGKRMLPTRIAHVVGEQNDLIEITSAEPVRSKEEIPSFRPTEQDTDATQYDAGASEAVEIKHLAGFLFVRPKVNGQEDGWFFLDTGADSMCIDPAYASKLNLPVIGADAAAGVVGVVQTHIRQADTFQLGPVTIQNPVFYEIELGPIKQAFKLPIIGICGYDFISRVVLDIDPTADVMHVLQPGRAVSRPDLPNGVNWTRIGFNSNTPALNCRFASDHEGYFNLDTGSGETVDFCTPAVEKFHLLTGQEGTKAMTGGAGGVAESRKVKIDWFELGGRRFDSPEVGMQLTHTGAFASPYFTGNIGMGFLGRFRLIIDYANERIAFLPPKAKQSTP
jgi:hypothetical protein